MKKIFFLVLFAILILFVLIGFYRSFDHSGRAPALALTAIPQSAAVIFVTHDIGNLWQKLSQSSLIWEELEATDYFFRLNMAAEALDSVLSHDPEIRSMLADKPIAISAHVSGARHFDFLFSVPIADDVVANKMVAKLSEIVHAEGAPEERLYDGVNLYGVESPLTDSKIFFFRTEGLLVLSKSSILAEEAIRALEQGASVLNNADFLAVRKTRGSRTEGELYLNHDVLNTIIGQHVSKATKEMVFLHYPYAAWSALDLKLKPNAIRLNGFILCRDSSDAWLGSFRNAEAPQMNVLSYMPSNTAFFVFYGFGNYDSFRARQMHIFGRTNRRYDVKHKFEVYNQKCDCNIKVGALSWIGNQAAAFITEPASMSYAQNHFAVIQAADIDAAWDKLCHLEDQVAQKLNTPKEIENFNGLEIHRLKIGNFYGALLSEAFDGLKNPYFTRIDNMVLMGTSLNGMRTLINKLQNKRESGTTLASDKRFRELSNQISGNSNLLIYSSLARSPFLFQKILSPEYAKSLENQTEILRKFQAFIYQVGYYKKDLYYNTIYFKYNPNFKKETGSLWEKKLDANVVSKPVLLKNHYTGALEVFVQDSENHIYLIDNKGKILWKKKIDGPIVSEVKQVDAYKNEKLQFIFSTETSIYLLDRNGNNVESYPVHLPAKATNGVSVADYAHNRNYRFFIGVDGGDILCYDYTGKPIEGWDFDGASANIVTDVKAIRIKTKDYLFALDADGKIYLLNRQGQPRHTVDAWIHPRAPGEIALDIQSTINTSGLFYIDSVGNAYRQGFDERFSKIKLAGAPVVDYAFVDLDGDGIVSCVLLTPERVEGFSLKGNLLFRHSLEKSAKRTLQTFAFPNDIIRFGITDPSRQEVILYDSDGQIHGGFPLFGAIPFAIGDMNNDGYFNLITAGKDAYVVAYAIE